MNTLASPLGSTARPPTSRINYAPLIVSLAVLAAGVNYLDQAVGWRQGALWIVGALLGATLYHASFGFTQAWRTFVSDRRGAGLRAQVIMLALGVVLFFPFMAHGSLFGQPVSGIVRSEEHTSELQSLMRNSYAVFCLKKKKDTPITH